MIRKQDFYEGAALHALARWGCVTGVKYVAPYFLVNDEVAILLKYSTKGRSPWGFTFAPEEQESLARQALEFRTVIGLICGSDGVAALRFDSFKHLVTGSGSSVRVACHRDFGEHYEITGPNGRLPRKVAPTSWQRILDDK